MNFLPVSDPADARLRDESRFAGSALAAADARSEADVADALAQMRARGLPLTLQGARTGITGGAVPDGGLLLSLAPLASIELLPPDASSPAPRLRAGPGARLADLRAACPPGWFFPVDPTEPTASLGGMLSCNASGSRSFLYGPVRPHVATLRVLLPDGTPLDLRRGQSAETVFDAPLPPVPRPAAVKNATAYFSAPGMDALDLFIGAEGTLGVIVEATLALSPLPPVVNTLFLYVRDADALAAADLLRPFRRGIPEVPSARLAALEYFDAASLDFLASRAVPFPTASRPPDTAALDLTFEAPSPSDAADAAAALLDLLAPCGADPDTAVWADSTAAAERLRAFRHALPEAVNDAIAAARRACPALHKCAADSAVPAAFLPAHLAACRAEAADAGIPLLLFGHLGDAHVHANLLPSSPATLAAAQSLLRRWAARAVANGGSLSAEHGIGKLKAPLFAELAPPETLAACRALKTRFDPPWLLNRGTLLLPPA
jgi:FAD/FMN-containing dehydrogenase